jgi:hypothetical protein
LTTICRDFLPIAKLFVRSKRPRFGRFLVERTGAIWAADQGGEPSQTGGIGVAKADGLTLRL